MIVAERIVADMDRLGVCTGNRLPAEQAMLEEYQVGRAALREALRLLEDRGLVELRPGRTGGPVVLEVGAREVAAHLGLTMRRLEMPETAVLEAWAELTHVVGQLTARRLTGGEVAALEASYAEMDHADGEDTARAELVGAILEASGNPMIDVLFRCLLEALDGVAPLGPLTRPEPDHAEATDRVIAVLAGLTGRHRRP
jgi:DNA-binding FadR family transcriptional regulator